MTTGTEQPGMSGGERRYSSSALSKVVRFATQLQQRHEETLTESQIEAIGAGVGLEPTFIRQALDELDSHPAVMKKRADRKKLDALILTFTLPVVAGALTYLTRHIPGSTSFFALFLAPLLAGLIGFVSGDPKAARAASRLLVFLIALWFMPWLFLYIPLGYFIAPKLAETGIDLRKQYLPEETETQDDADENISRQDLLHAMMILRAELESQKQRYAFLSVDVVGSTEMVTHSPEHEAEYTFHRFRTWVEGIVKESGGEITSSAGDGVMCRFSEDEKAVRAAQVLQQEIHRFNVEQNHLSQPFRIRCGVSAGEVALEEGKTLSDVQSPAIYRAAMLQKQAEPGAIVVGKEVSASTRIEVMSTAALPPEPKPEATHAPHSPHQLTEG